MFYILVPNLSLETRINISVAKLELGAQVRPQAGAWGREEMVGNAHPTFNCAKASSFI
jgi:hypothetical protein